MNIQNLLSKILKHGKSKLGEIYFSTTQEATGHGVFRTYLHRQATINTGTAMKLKHNLLLHKMEHRKGLKKLQMRSTHHQRYVTYQS